MKKVILDNKGQLFTRDQVYFGGKYSFIERFRMGGIGSKKVMYKSGVPYFDELAFVENEISFANFELLKNGLLIRVFRNLKFRYIGFQLNEILKVQFITISSLNAGLNYLKIYTLNDDIITFEVSLQHSKAIQSFFGKKIFDEKFEMKQTR